MEETSFINASERDIYSYYDAQRRLRMTKFLAPFFTVLISLYLVTLCSFALFTSSNHPPLLMATIASIGGCLGLFIVGTITAYRGQVTLSSNVTIIATALAIVSVLFGYTFSLGYDPLSMTGSASLLIIIVLAGVIGAPRSVIVTTLLLNALMVFLTYFAAVNPIITYLYAKELPLIGPSALIQQWATAVLIIAATNVYRGTLRELGNVRIAYDRARKLDDLKDQFISSVNHELRNPVMALQGYLEIMQMAAPTASRERMGSLIDRANRAGDDLRDLLASILETRRMDQGAEDFIPEVVNIVDALEAATRMIDPREGKTIERELRITVPPDTQIWGEKVRLQQILTNLLSNAIKYSEAGTAVEVVAQPVTAVTSEIFRWGRRTKTEEAMVEITVRDFGLGIPPEYATLLFQRFVRLPRDLASNVIGNGLGLHLCRVFAQAMGGTIWVESSGVEGEGSTFHLRLPAPPPLMDQHESSQATPEIIAGASSMITHRQ